MNTELLVTDTGRNSDYVTVEQSDKIGNTYLVRLHIYEHADSRDDKKCEDKSRIYTIVFLNDKEWRGANNENNK